MKRSVLEVGLLAALCALSASNALAQFTNIQQSPWQGGVNHFCGNTWISNSMTLNNSGSLIYNTSTLPANTGPLDGRSGDYWFGISVLVDGSDGATINDNSGGTIQGIVTGTGEAMAAGIYSIQNVTVNNSGTVDGEVQNHDGWAVGVWADSGGVNITNNAGATISATATWQAQGIQVGQHVNVVNNGTVTATATGGTQGNTANTSQVNGINVFSYTTDGSCPIYMENNGTLTANCTGGTSVTNSGRAVGLWAEGSSVAFRNTGLVTTSMTPGSQGEVDCSYIGADNADVSFYNSGTFSQTVNGVCVWLEQDSDVGDMRIDNSGIIASSQTWAIELGQYNDSNTSGHCYVTNTGSISGGWLGLAWNQSGGFTFYESGDIHVGMSWLGGNSDVHVFGLPTWDSTLNNWGSGGSNLVFNLIGTLQKVNGNAASGTNLSAFNLGSSGSIVVSGKTYGWNAFTTVSGTVSPTGSVPPPWQQRDIGSVGVAGGAVLCGGMFALLASGNDIGGTGDAFHYVYQPVSNNCTLIARVSAEQTASANAKGGVMIRDKLNTNAANAFIGVMPGNRVVFQYRSSDGGGSSSNSVTGLSASYWVKLAQSGNTLTGYYSVDGVKWTQLGAATNSMASTNYAGLAYCNNNSSSGTVTFYSVTCAGGLFVPSAPTGLTATAGVEQVALNWQAASNAASYNIGRSTVSGGPYTTVGSTSGTNYTDADLAGRMTYYYVVTTVNVGGQGADSAQVSATPVANVPPPWVAQDIGPVKVNGGESYTNNVFTVTASGNDIASAVDAFRFVYETNSGNCTIVARVASLQNIDGWSKAGVMIRGSLNANAANVFIGMTPSNGVTFEHRSADGVLEGVDNNVTNPAVPCWVALVQSGSTFTGYYSADGVNWTQLGTTTVSMGVTKYVGMAVCARKTLSLCTATFDNVSAPGWPSLAGPTGLTATATSSGQVNLKWNALTNATSYIVKRSTVSGGPYSIIARGLTATNFTDNIVAVGIKYYYVVSAIIGGLESSGSPEATVNLPLPYPWVSQDVGAVGVAGSAAYGNGVFTMAGTGADIWGTADAFLFAYVPVTGNCTIIARVVSVQNIDAWSKAGVMIRESTNANAANAFIAVTPGNGVTWQTRSTTGGSSGNAATAGLSAPYWMKLVRSGNTFTGYRSPDGTNWTQQGTATFTMASSTVYVGLALTSHNNSSLCMATFDNVTAPGWPLLPSAPGNLTATAGSAQVTLSWPAASGASSYNLKSATNNGGPYVVLTNVTTTIYTNIGLINGSTYYYVVSALNIAGESTNSVPASATPQAPPTLNISQPSTNLMFSWPATSAGFTLQSSTNLASGSWVTVTSAGLQSTNGQWQVILPPSTNARSMFYRLFK